jgi:hypothetical protein
VTFPLSPLTPQLPSAQAIPAVPPGDPAAIAAAARTYAAAADRMGALSGQLSGIVDRTTGSAWSGPAAQAYIGNAMQVSSEFGNARNALGEGAVVLSSYARELAQAQEMARSAGQSMSQLNDQVGALSTQVATADLHGGGLLLSPHLQQMASDIADGQKRVTAMAADAMAAAHASARKAAAGFEKVAKSTVAGEQASAAARQQAAQAAAQKAAESKQHHSMWAIGGLVLGDIALTGVNALQLGLDPVTDGAEVADTGALVAEGTDVAATTAASGLGAAATATAADEATALAEEVGPGSVQRLVIGRMRDLEVPGALGDDEYTILDQLTPDLGEPQANWIRNSSVLRNEIRNGVTEIRDASPGDTSGQFLNAERNVLENKGWIYDAVSHLWKAPMP